MRTNKLLLTIACIFLFHPPASGAERDAAGPLVVPGQFSIQHPPGGLKWRKVRDVQIPDGTTGQLYVARREQDGTQVTLVVENRPFPKKGEKGADRAEYVRGARRGFLKILEKGGYRDLSGDEPSLKTTVPDLVTFGVRGKDKDGDPAFFEGVVVFGAKNTYQFQAFAASAEDASLLGRVASTLKE